MNKYREGFHTELKSFLKNLCATFENDRELLMITSSIHVALMNDDDDEVIAKFYTLLTPFATMIESRDPNFFYQNHAAHTDYKLFKKLNVYWEQLSAKDQQVVWDYLQVLYKLCSKLII
jgi:hypothetical protein